MNNVLKNKKKGDDEDCDINNQILKSMIKAYDRYIMKQNEELAVTSTEDDFIDYVF